MPLHFELHFELHFATSEFSFCRSRLLQPVGLVALDPMNASSADVRRVAEGAENGARLEEWRAIRPTKKQVGGCAYDCMDKCVQACPAGFNAKRCGDLCAPQCHRHCGQ